MAIELGKGVGTSIQTPQTLKRKSFARKAGEFILPTTTGLLTGEKDLSLRTGLGAALEVGSFAIPSTAVLRGLGIAGKVARGAKTATKVAKKAPEPATLESIRKGGREIATRLGREAKTSAKIGAVTGTAFGAGRGLGDEELSLREVAGEAALTGAFGAAGGAILAPAISLTSLSAKKLTGFTSNKFRAVNATLNPTARKEAVTELTESLSKSYEESSSIFGKLSKHAEQVRTQKGETFGIKNLFEEMVDEGQHIPKIRGTTFGEQRGDFKGGIQNLDTRIGSLSKGVTELAKRTSKTTKLSDLEKAAKARLIGRTDIDPTKVSKQINSIVKNLKAEFKTDILSAEQVDIIRRRTTKGTQAFKKALRTGFVDDAQNSLRSVSRSRLNDINPDITRLNAKSVQLFRIKKTMEILDNQKIDVGFLSTAMGRYLGVLAGAGAIAGGPGALVVAGVMAQLGSRFVANMIRQFRFNPQLQNVIKQGLRSDKKLLQEVLKDASPADSALIKRAVQEPVQRKRSFGTKSAPITSKTTQNKISKKPITKTVAQQKQKVKAFGAKKSSEVFKGLSAKDKAAILERRKEGSFGKKK